MATISELRTRIRELESENESLEQETADLRDTLERIAGLATGEEESDEDAEVEEEQ